VIIFPVCFHSHSNNIMGPGKRLPRRRCSSTLAGIKCLLVFCFHFTSSPLIAVWLSIYAELLLAKRTMQSLGCAHQTKRFFSCRDSPAITEPKKRSYPGNLWQRFGNVVFFSVTSPGTETLTSSRQDHQGSWKQNRQRRYREERCRISK
jgi:hypothetical protein